MGEGQQQQQHVLPLAIQHAQHLHHHPEQDPFAPTPRLDDVNTDKAPPLLSYASLDQLTPSLTQRLHRLWHERGDFSKFKSSSLNTAAAAAEPVDVDHPFPSYGIPSPPLPPSSSNHNNTASASSQYQRPSSISLQDAETLKTDMLNRIGNAHFATYFLHNLLALLLQQQTTQRKLEQQQQLHQHQLEQAIPGSKLSASKTRSGTPLAEQDSSAAAAAAAAAAHSEPYFDPTILGLSEVYRDPILHPAAPAQNNQAANIDDDDDDDNDNDDKDERISNQDGAQQPDSIPLHQTPLPALATTRATLSRASAILSRGASSIRRVSKLPSEQVRWSSLAHVRTSSSASPPSSFSSSSSQSPRAEASGSSHSRKEASSAVPAATWKLSPPPQNVGVGTAVWWAGLSAREDGEGAGAKDAWIGYGLPELQPRMRRNALAYFADDDDDHHHRAAEQEVEDVMMAAAAAADGPEGRGKTKREDSVSTSPLVFVHRPRRRLRLQLKGPQGQLHSADSSSAPADVRRRKNQNAWAQIQSSLREAQEELMDEELWAELCTQVRDSPGVLLRVGASPAGAAAAAAAVNALPGSGSARSVIPSKAESMEVKLGGDWLMCLQMAVHSTTGETHYQADVDDPDSQRSAFPRALLAYLRLSLIRSIRIRLKAAAINAVSNPAPSAANTSKTNNQKGDPIVGPQTHIKKGLNSNNKAGKSIIQLEREAAAANAKRGVGAYEVVSNPTTNSAASNNSKGQAQQQQQQQQKDGAVAAAQAATQALQKERHLDPILGLFRYAKFISDIERTLDDLIAQSAGAEGTSSRLVGGQEQRIWYRLAPMASLVDSADWMCTLLGDARYPAGLSRAAPPVGQPVPTFPLQQMEAVKMLSGVGTVFFNESPLVLISFSYPARLTLQFCRRRNGPTATIESPSSPSSSSLGADGRAASTPAAAHPTPRPGQGESNKARSSAIPPNANTASAASSATAGMWTGELSLRVFADFVGRELASVQRST